MRLLLTVGWLLLAAGCSTHYYRIKADKLEIYLEKPGARKVIFACSLDDFKPHEASNLDGCWVVTVHRQDQFRYFYMIDGELFLPPCRLKEKDDFGSENCIFDSEL